MSQVMPPDSAFASRLARLIVDPGWPVVRAAERYNVSWPTARRWAARYASSSITTPLRLAIGA